MIEIQDLSMSLKLTNHNLLEHFKVAETLSKDKRMIATLSNILSSFQLNYVIKDDFLTLEGTSFEINDESSAMVFQAKLIDAYHFFRNVINTQNKKDIVSEIYNKKVSKEIKTQFEEHVVDYINVLKNQDLIDWIITISKESKYTLKINYDEQGVFYIDGSIIVTPQDAEDYYIGYMDKKKEKLAMAVYHNGIVNKIKRVWMLIKSKFSKIPAEK